MLRESSKISNEAVELKDVSRGLSEGTAIAHATILVEFAEAVVARNATRIAPAREAVRKAMGDVPFVDAAAVAAAFHGFVRIADSIGIPYKTAAAGEDLPDVREAAGVNDFFRLQNESRPHA